jgi:hypothetical protein
MKLTDTQILNWIERNPFTVRCHLPATGRRYWYRIMGRRDQTNRFSTLRKAVAEQICAEYSGDPASSSNRHNDSHLDS